MGMKKKNGARSYVITTYLVFGLMVLGICGGASMIFHAPPLVMRILSNICAWSPTIVLMIMWSRLRPNQSRREFWKEAFSGDINFLLLVIPPVIVVGGSLLTVWIVSIIQKKSFASYYSLGAYPLLASFFLSLLSGPTGEEAGWRGYLRVELNKKYSFMRASIVQGLIWAFWHTVLWFVDSDFTGLYLIPYIISNVIVMTSLVIIMNVVLEKQNNLFYSIVIHFAFNFIYCFLLVDIAFYVVLSVVYLLIAMGVLYYRRKSKNVIGSM